MNVYLVGERLRMAPSAALTRAWWRDPVRHMTKDEVFPVGESNLKEHYGINVEEKMLGDYRLKLCNLLPPGRGWDDMMAREMALRLAMHILERPYSCKIIVLGHNVGRAFFFDGDFGHVGVALSTPALLLPYPSSWENDPANKGKCRTWVEEFTKT